MNRLNSRARLLASLSVAACAWSVPGAALAQESSATEAEGGLADIIVTARRVEERLQEVPLSITAMNDETLRAQQITKVQDLGATVPNLITGKTSVPGAGTVTIRGVQGQGLPRPGLDNRVGVYLDGVYLARAQGQSFGLADIASIEVLKGPQGTLFGRNVTAGAISISTKTASQEFGANLEGTVGNHGKMRLRGTVNVPLSDALALRVTYSHDQEDGDVKNRAAGRTWGALTVSVPALAANYFTPGKFQADGVTPLTPASPAFSMGPLSFKPSAKTLGASSVDSVYANLHYTGIEGVDVDYRFDLTDQWETSQQMQILGFAPMVGFGCTPVSILLGVNPGQCAFNSPGVISTAPTLTNVGGQNGFFYGTGAQNFVFGAKKAPFAYDDLTGKSTVKTWGHNLTIATQISDAIAVKSITGYRDLRTRSQSGADSVDASLNNSYLTAQDPVRYPASSYPAGGVTPFMLGASVTQQKQHQFSQELQAYGSVTPFLDYLVGVYYFSETASYNQRSVLANAALTSSVSTAVKQAGTTPIGLPPLNLVPGVNNLGLGFLLAGDATVARSKSKAAFGRVTIKPVEALSLVVGARYTRDEKRSRIPQFMANFLDADPITAGQQPPAATVAKNFSRFTWDATATYSFTPDINVYLRYATAYLAGGFLRNIPFDPETTKSWEIGFKSEFLDRHVRLNAAAFDQRSKDYQFTQTSSVPTSVGSVTATALRNLGSAKVRGFEAELTVLPVDGLTLGGSVGLARQWYSSPIAGIAPNHPVQPEWTAQLLAQYDTQPIAGDAYLAFRIDANYRSSVFPNATNIAVATAAAPSTSKLPAEFLALYGLTTSEADVLKYAQYLDKFSKIGGFWTVNARVSLLDIPVGNTKAHASAWVRNLFDKTGLVQAANYGMAMGGVFSQNRRIGLDIGIDF